ncbi:alkene reductase [Paraburkholderia terrae]|uniref:alkene reductase n=1 Tax=Paraburkholderia terrae TaxID=311230 RepID=UPI00205600C8|nr:alkene reductase [Paraburkholderia terrae]BDC45942.1 alkene reductase [Paraburkholderia terrae]
MLLLDSHHFGRLSLANRIVMAPMTRSRASQPGDIPNALMATYYAQRASAGLIVTEGTPISPVGRGYSLTPGIYTPEQIAGWSSVTQAVHENHGKIFVQLWHVGRRSHESIAGQTPVSASALKDPDKVYGPLPEGGFGMIETGVPRAMTLQDIQETIEEFVNAAAHAISAGFDGVELHGAHGYLIDQFMRVASNQRNDAYGGSQHNRMRFLIEVTQAVAQRIGSDRVGLRVSPFVTEGYAQVDPEIGDLTLKALESLAPLKLAYVHFSENISRYVEMPWEYRARARRLYPNPIMVAGKYTAASAEHMLRSGLADLVAFGQPFITNPDFVARVAKGSPLTPVNYEAHSTFYGGGAEGYTDYPEADVVTAPA